MDPVVLGLSVAIAVIIVLLLSCRDKNSGKKAEKPARKPARSNDDSQARSDWGSGVANRKLANQYGDLADLSSYEDYNAVAQYMSVEPEVFESHSRYSRDMGRSTSGASTMSVRDDPNDVVPWVGLRRVDYRSVYAGNNVRQEHSEIPDQMPQRGSYCL
jgi:hypothetical protein